MFIVTNNPDTGGVTFCKDMDELVNTLQKITDEYGIFEATACQAFEIKREIKWRIDQTVNIFD